MKILIPFTFNQTTFQPIILEDGTLLLAHCTPDAIHIVDANNLYQYAISYRGVDAAYVLPKDTDVKAWVAETFNEKPFHTGVIFGRDASESFEWENDSWFGEDKNRLSYEDAEKKASEAGGNFIHRIWETEAEREAYRQGIDDVFDWQGYTDLEVMYSATFDENGMTFPKGSE